MILTYLVTLFSIWFSGLAYLITLVPTIWLLELAFLQKRQESSNALNITSTVTTLKPPDDKKTYMVSYLLNYLTTGDFHVINSNIV